MSVFIGLQRLFSIFSLRRPEALESEFFSVGFPGDMWDLTQVQLGLTGSRGWCLLGPVFAVG